MTPQSPAPFSIRMFLPSGTAEGVKIIEKSNRVGRAISGPRSRFDELRKRPEFSKTGVYVLTGQANPDDLPRIYIGEGDPVADRLISHQKLKDFWSSVVFFINNSKDDYLNKAHVQYLEARLVGLAKDAKRCVLDNNNIPQKPALSEMDTADMDVFLEQMLLIFGVLGINVFLRPPAVASSTLLFHLDAKRLTATGYEVDDGFVVQAGSESPKDAVPSTPEAIVKLRQNLLSQGVFIDQKDRYRLAQDYIFGSPSTAAAVMLARPANGRIEWKDDTGRTLKDIQEQEA